MNQISVVKTVGAVGPLRITLGFEIDSTDTTLVENFAASLGNFLNDILSPEERRKFLRELKIAAAAAGDRDV